MKLFDEDNPLDEIEPSFENMDEQTEIENNNNNDGEFEFQLFGTFAVDENWMTKNYSELRYLHETFEMEKLKNNLYDIFVESRFYEKYKDYSSKVTKQDLLDIFLHFYENIEDGDRYSEMDKFCEIADFFGINYDLLYKEIPITIKQKLIVDMDEKYQMLNGGTKVKKLF